MKIFKKIQEYLSARKEYQTYLEDMEQQSYQQYFPFIVIDYSKQKKLQPAKFYVNKTFDYRITFNNKLVEVDNSLMLEERQSFLDPDIFLFHGNKRIYTNFLVEQKTKQTMINKFIYSELKSPLHLEEKLSYLSLKSQQFNGISFKKYLERIEPEKTKYEDFYFLKNIESEINRIQMLEKYIDRIITNYQKRMSKND